MDIAEGPTANNSAARVSGPIGKVVESLAAIARVLHGRRLDRNCQSLSLLIIERENIAELVRRLDGSLADCSWEVIFVDDDSPDGTFDLIREIAQRDFRIRCVHRINRRGLSSAA